MGIFSNLFNKFKYQFQRWREVGEYRSTFTSFGGDAFKSEIVRSCIRPLADFTGKANCRSTNKDVERLLNTHPNVYMNGKEFLKKVRTLYELHNNCFIYIERGANGKPTGFFPVNYKWLEALEYNKVLFIRFHFVDGSSVVLPWADLAVVRKDYNESNLTGDDNRAILDTLDLIQTTNQGIANAVRATANLRGILKSTKAMLAPEAIKEQKEQFVKDYLSLENEGGIASLDATQDFTPITMSPIVASYEQIKEFRERVQRFFGVSDSIMMASASPEEIESFYELRIEPFLVDLSEELTAKAFTPREIGCGNWIVFEANKLQFASLDKKIQIFTQVVLYGGMTVNEWRAGCNMAPIDGGDELIRRLDAAPVDSTPNESEDNDDV